MKMSSWIGKRTKRQPETLKASMAQEYLKKHVSCKRQLVKQNKPRKNISFFVNNFGVLRKSNNLYAHLH